ncbi:MAG TPA: DsbA family oxidoreductase [Solirubrobacteraceae bacterium]|jgi:predicted DsbA family dithiol-disulfide isomerase|nr:DsbA family oxidoreductase [Solirubrobacteraceae bacterium]
MDIEIWSDIACPWCFIGKRRLESALAQFEHRDKVNIIWRSFELDPSAPPERTGDRAERLARKYGMTVEQARAAEQQLVATAAAEGLGFRFDIARSGSTVDGHRLVHLAQRHGLGDAMKERLLRAYFEQGELIADHDALARLAGEVGLPADEVRAMLAGEDLIDEVRDDEQLAGELGIQAVPTFIIDRAVGVSGAQDPAMLLELLRRGWERQVPAPAGAL